MKNLLISIAIIILTMGCKKGKGGKR